MKSNNKITVPFFEIYTDQKPPKSTPLGRTAPIHLSLHIKHRYIYETFFDKNNTLIDGSAGGSRHSDVLSSSSQDLGEE